VTGLHWGMYATQEPARVRETFDALTRLYLEGKLKPVIFRRYPLQDLALALVALGARRTYGKLVVTL